WPVRTCHGALSLVALLSPSAASQTTRQEGGRLGEPFPRLQQKITPSLDDGG
ncbi:unnamed protein product, partial [Ascophyllum nodosum]